MESKKDRPQKHSPDNYQQIFKKEVIRDIMQTQIQKGRPRKELPKIKVDWDIIEGVNEEQQKLFFCKNLANWGKALYNFAEEMPIDKKKYREFARVLTDLGLLVSDSISDKPTEN